MTSEIIEVETRPHQGKNGLTEASNQQLNNGKQDSKDQQESSGQHHSDGQNRRQDQAKETDTKKLPENDTSKDPADELDLSCGIGRLRTNIFGRRFANLYVFAVFFGLSNLFSQMLDQVIQVQLTSLERQFNIDNARAGLFQTASRIGFISTLLFAGHFAKRYHIPLIVGSAGVIQGLLLIIPAIMQFVDPYELPLLPPNKNQSVNTTKDFGDSAKYMCQDNELTVSSNTNSTIGEIKQAQFIIILAVQAAKGLTDTFHNGFLPVLYMDDNLLDKTKMGIILGIWQVISELSGPIGKQVNGIITEVPIDLKASDLGPEDRRFVSAWWLGFLVFGTGVAVFSLPIMLFPRSLVTARQKKAALDEALVTFAGGHIPDEVAVSPENEEEEEEEETTGTAPPAAPAVTAAESRDTTAGNPDDLLDTRRGSYNVSSFRRSQRSSKRRSSEIHRFSGSRRPSLFPAVEGPTVRKVSITGDLVFNQPIKKQESIKEEDFTDLLKDFPRALLRVLSKPVVVLILVDISVVSIPFSGTSMFRNTYMQNEYNISMAEVALVTAITTAVGSISGTIASSWVSSKVTTKTGYAMWMFCTWFITLIAIPFYFVFGCGNEIVYGAEGEFGRSENLTSCNCSLSRQLLSCGDDNNNYISPCYVGCGDVDKNLFVDCNLLNVSSGTSLRPGLCETDCHVNFLIYTILHGVQYFFYAVSMVPRRLLLLRIVDPQDRGFATSLFSFCFVLTGIPSANLFGSIIDDTCLIWDDGFCSLYDRDKIRYLMSGIDMGTHISTQLTFLVMVIIFKREERKVKAAEKKQAADIEIKVTQPDTNQGLKTA